MIRKNILCFSILFTLYSTVSFSQSGTDTTLIPQIQDDFTSDSYFLVGFGSSAHFSPSKAQERGKIFGYYLTASVVKSISPNFNLSSGIDVYSLPHLKSRMIGQVNLNAAYIYRFNKNMSLNLGAGLFTGFVSWQERKRSGGFVSGLLLNSAFLYKISPDHAMGISIKYPFITEESSMLLSGLFFTF